MGRSYWSVGEEDADNVNVVDFIQAAARMKWAPTSPDMSADDLDWLVYKTAKQMFELLKESVFQQANGEWNRRLVPYDKAGLELRGLPAGGELESFRNVYFRRAALYPFADEKWSVTQAGERAPNWSKWRLIPTVRVWQAVALSLNIDPDKILTNAQAWMGAPHPFAEGNEFNTRLDVLLANLTDRKWFPTPTVLSLEAAYKHGVDLVDFAQFALEKAAWLMPVELCSLVTPRLEEARLAAEAEAEAHALVEAEANAGALAEAEVQADAGAEPEAQAEPEQAQFAESQVSVTSVVHSTKVQRADLLNVVISDVIFKMGKGRSTAGAWTILREMALEGVPPLKGTTNKGRAGIEWTNAQNEVELCTYDSFRGRYRRLVEKLTAEGY